MKNGKPFPIPVRSQEKRVVRYSCAKCPAYCCTYTDIAVTPSDVERLARHFGIGYAAAEERFTKEDPQLHHRQLRHRKDKVFDSTCMFLDQEKRRCTVYAARPGTCRKYPDSARCGYYEFLKFEREQQGDAAWIALT
jgi:Fe-S-cluster containining protein